MPSRDKKSKVTSSVILDTQKLVRARLEAELTQEAFAAAADISVSSVIRAEGGKPIAKDTARSIGIALGVPFESLQIDTIFRDEGVPAIVKPGYEISGLFRMPFATAEQLDDFLYECEAEFEAGIKKLDFSGIVFKPRRSDGVITCLVYEQGTEATRLFFKFNHNRSSDKPIEVFNGQINSSAHLICHFGFGQIPHNDALRIRGEGPLFAGYSSLHRYMSPRQAPSAVMHELMKDRPII